MQTNSEEWRIIHDFPNYAVSSLGHVMRAIPSTRSEVGHLLAIRINQWGYHLVHLRSNTRDTHRPIHRLVAAAFLGPCPPNHEVNHLSGNKSDNAVTNLQYVTKSENHRHAYRFDLRSHVGSKHPRATLTEADVLLIRAVQRTTLSNIAWGHQKRTLAARFGTTVRVIETIRSRQNWTHV